MPFLLWFVNALRGENKIKNMSAIFFKNIYHSCISIRKKTGLSSLQTNKLMDILSKGQFGFTATQPSLRKRFL